MKQESALARRQTRLNQLKQMLNRHLPRVRFDIDEDDDVTGVSAISIVDNPAIGSGFIALKRSSKERYQRAVQRMKKIQASWD